MSEIETVAVAVADAPEMAPVPSGFPVTLDEFCARLSLADKRVELIGAFHNAEKAANHMRDTESNYAARFTAFINQPA